MAASRQLFLFGRPRFADSGDERELTYRKGLALFAYLDTTGQRHSRDVLAALFWTDYSQTRARANLRRTLYAINQAGLGGWIAADPDSIDLVDTPAVYSDVAQFRELIEQWHAHNHPADTACDNCADILSRAINLYTADFLADFYLADSNTFEEWAGLQREQLRLNFLQAADALAAFSLARGDFAAVQTIAYRQIERDNLRENAYRLLMTALAHNGQRSSALQVYADLERLLYDELGMDPEEASQALAQELKTGNWELRADNRQLKTENLIVSRDQKDKASTSHNPQSPYRGLYSFREEDAHLFFGREEFSEQLLEQIRDQSIAAVIGPSGSGKSSVVYAGLVAQLRSQDGYAIASFRPTADPFFSLADTLLPLLKPDLDDSTLLFETHNLAHALAVGESNLTDILQQLLARQDAQRLVLIADQFEELYTLGSDVDARHRFLDILLDPVFDQQYRALPQFTLLLTLRADFLGQALAFRPLADALRDADIKLGPMTVAELGRAIVEPAAAHGVALESGLAARLRDDVAGEPGNLPLLEFALEMLWQQQETGVLTHEAYEAIGRVDGALSRYADEIYHALAPEAQAAAQRIFIQLVQPGEGTEDSRRVATRAELGEKDWSAVQELADARLLVAGINAEGRETAELVHEALIGCWDRLDRWMAADRGFRLWQEQLRAAMHQWEASDRDEGAYLRGVPLSVAGRQLAERPAELSQAEIAFINAGLALREQHRAAAAVERASREQQRRRVTWVAAIGLVIMAILAAVAGLQWRQADAQRQAAETAELEARRQLAAQLAARAQILQDDQLDVALLLGAEAVQLVDNETTRAALKDVLQHNPTLLRQAPLPFNPFAVTARNGPPQWANQFIIHSEGAEEVTVWSPDWEGARLIQQDTIPFPIAGKTLHTLANSHDGALLAMALCDSPGSEPCKNPQIALWRTEQARLDDDTLGDYSRELTALALNPDGSLLAQGNIDGTILLWNTEQMLELGEPLQGHSDVVRLLAFSPDGKRLASWSRDGLVTLWDIKKRTAVPAAQFDGHGATASLTFSTDSRLLLSAAQTDDRLFVWDVEQVIEGQVDPIWRLDGPQGGSYLAEFSPNGRFLLAGGNNGDIYQWTVGDLAQSAPEPHVLRGHQEFVAVFFFDPDESTMLSMAPDATILWDLDGATLPMRSLAGHEQHVVNLAFSPDGNTLYSTACNIVGSGGPCKAAEFQTWNTRSAAAQGALQYGPPVETWSSRLGAYGALAFLGGSAEALTFANPAASGGGQEPMSLPVPLAGTFALSPDGRLLATGNCQEADLSIPRCLSSTLSLWDWPAGTLRSQVLDAHEGLIQDIAFAPDSGSLATAGQDSVLLLWDLADSDLRSRRINNGVEEVHDAIAFSPSGEQIAGAGCGYDEAHGDCKGGAIWLWNLEDGERAAGPLLNDETVFFFFLEFSPDGQYLATVDGAGQVIFWDSASGERIAQVFAHTGPIDAMRFSPGGTLRLATGGRDRLVNLFNVDALLAQADLSAEGSVAQACRRAGRSFSATEWSSFFGETPYRATCPQ